MFEESLSIWASMNSWFTPAVLFVLLNLMIGIIAIASNLGTNQKHQDPQNQQQGLARSPSVLQRIKSISLYRYRSPELHTNTLEKKPETTETTHYAFRHTQEPEQPQFTRSPSLLERLKSYIPQDFSTNPSQPITTTTTLHKTQEPESHFKQAPEHDQFQDDDHFEDHEHPKSPEPEEEEGEHPESPETEEEEEKEHPESPETEEEEEQSLDEIYSQLKPLQDHHVSRTKSDTKPASGEVPTKLPKKMKKSASSKSTFGHFKEEDIVEIRRPATVRERKANKVTEDEEVDAKADDFINKFKNQLKLQRLDSIIRYKDMVNRGT